MVCLTSFPPTRLRSDVALRAWQMAMASASARAPGRPGRDEVYAQVAAIIEHELSPVQRSIVRMREYEGLDFDDIARRLDLQPSNVRVQLSRARKRIRQIYRERHQQ